MAAGELQAQASKLEELALARFHNQLSAAELKLARAAPRSEVAYCGPSNHDDDPDNDPSHANSKENGWGKERVIRAELIRWLCVDRRASNHVDPQGIMVHGAKVDGELDLSYVTVPFPIRLWFCALTNDAHLRSMQIPELDLAGSLVRSVHADGAIVKGDLFLRRRFRAEGEVVLLGATVGGDFDCSGARFVNPPRKELPGSGAALTADGIAVKGNVFLSKFLSRIFHAEGEVRFLGAQIGRNLDCQGGRFINPPISGLMESGKAFSADGINVNGSVFLANAFHAEGAVRLLDARIGTNLECEGGEFVNPQKQNVDGSGDALISDRADVKGDVFLNDRFSAKGTIVLAGARIQGNLDCRKGRFKGSTLVLERASAGSMMDDAGSWPDRGNLYLDGFIYGRMVYGQTAGVPGDAETRLRWLNLQPGKPFAPQPYLQLAKVLSEAGDDDGARRVLIEMEDQRWNSKQDHRWTDPLQRWPLKVTVGYGYRPLWAFWEVLGLSALGWIVYRRSYLAGSMVPTDKDANQSFKSDGQSPTHYSAFVPLVYSVENSLPLVKLGQVDKWQPDPTAAVLSRKRGWAKTLGRPLTWPRFLSWFHRILVFTGLQAPADLDKPPSRLSRWGTSPTFLRWFLWVQILLGWLLATLFLAGVTGIVRKQ